MIFNKKMVLVLLLCIPMYMKSSEEKSIIKNMLQQINNSLGIIASFYQWQADAINHAMQKEVKRKDTDKGYTVILSSSARNNRLTDGKVFKTSQGHKLGYKSEITSDIVSVNEYRSIARDRWIKYQEVKNKKNPKIFSFLYDNQEKLNTLQEKKLVEYYKINDVLNNDSSMREVYPHLLNDLLFPKVPIFKQQMRCYMDSCEREATGDNSRVLGTHKKQTFYNTSDLLDANGRMK